MVTSNIDPRHHDSPEIRSWHYSSTCVATRGELRRTIFQQDNVHLHAARASLDYLRRISTFSWTALSPDLSPIEHI
ncbi:hypothetical protein TNCV_2295101 [Trichonephila clavipes]|nr:hypothetical protein TNCV_2295101 [Trichonephila clavipes]